jgi:hypothetical protein
MMNYHYSPDTGELIVTDNPAEWMGVTTAAPPAFNAQKQGCFWRDEAWEIVDPVPEPVPVPKSVTRFKAIAALYNAGLLTAIEAAVTAAGGLTKIAWDEAQEFERSSPTIAALQGALGLTDAQIDDLFITAATLTA